MEENSFVCPICGNKDPLYIGNRNGHPYCRKCITFKGETISKDIKYPKNAYYKLSYNLTEDQLRLSNQLLINYKKGINSLVHAVCGAGKTEIVLEVIKYAIECGERVGFAIPRKDVVIELTQRFKSIFKKNIVISLYGGHVNKLEGDLIILTTHQLYRYDDYFDLLIIDEIDAFPFNNNEVLISLFKRSIKYRYILMSATPSDEIIKEFKKPGFQILELFTRFHMAPLPVPIIIKRKWVFMYVELIRKLKQYLKANKPVFIFAPTIDLSKQIFNFLRIFFHQGNLVNSKIKNREQIINDFRSGKIKYLVTTAVLERGVTIKDLQVIIFKADNPIYSSHALIQISGRVGRKKEATDGELIFLIEEENENISKCINEIKRSNASLQNLF